MSRRALKLVPPTAPRRAPRQDRARVTCDAILIAAERVLERDGVAHLTTNRVAEVAGVSIGSVYQYYPNKQALVAALIERNNGEMITLVREQLALHPTSPPEVAAVAVGFGIRAAFHRQAKVHLALWEHMATLGLTRAFEDSLDALTDALATWIAGNPSIKSDDPRTTAWVIVRSVEGVMRSQSIGLHAIDEDAVIRETASMLLRHLRKA